MGMNMDMPINIASLAITPQMLSLIAEIDEFKGAWRALGTLAPDRLSALRRVATIDSIGSSTRIEGSKLSDSDVERLLSNIEIQHFATRDEQEVAGYAEVMETIFASFDEISPTENHIKQLHRDLLAWYQTIITRAAEHYSHEHHDGWLKVLSAPMDIRGYGPVRMAAAEKVKAEVSARLETL
mgnify:CR=1 FL=1